MARVLALAAQLQKTVLAKTRPVKPANAPVANANLTTSPTAQQPQGIQTPDTANKPNATARATPRSWTTTTTHQRAHRARPVNATTENHRMSTSAQEHPAEPTPPATARVRVLDAHPHRRAMARTLPAKPRHAQLASAASTTHPTAPRPQATQDTASNTNATVRVAPRSSQMRPTSHRAPRAPQVTATETPLPKPTF